MTENAGTEAIFQETETDQEEEFLIDLEDFYDLLMEQQEQM